MPAVVEFGFNAAPVFAGVSRMDQQLQGLDAKQARRSQRMAADGRMQLSLLEAQISGNKKEAASIQQRISLLERMRTVQQQTNVSQREAYSLAQRSMPRGGAMSGGSKWAVGNAAMQAQDIAVQMQMGTKASTIIAQQGSQLLSVFGPAGMIVGGLVAVGGLFYGMQQKGVEALQALQKEAGGFDQSLRVLKVGGIMEMISGMEKMQERADELKLDASSRTGSGMFEGAARALSWTTFDETGKGTKNYDLRRDASAELAAKHEQGRKDLMEQIVKTAEEELSIAQARAAGRDAEADQLTRQVAMRRELAKFDTAPTEIKGKMQDNVRAKFAAEQQLADATAAKEKQGQMDKIAAAQTQLDEQKKDAALDQMTLAQRIAIMSADAQKALAEENQLKGAAKLDTLAIIDAESRRVSIQSQLLNSQRHLSTEKEREADATRRAAEQAEAAAKQAATAAAAAATARRGSVMDTALEFKLLQAKASGRMREVEEIEKQQRILERAQRLEQQNGLSKRDALSLAMKMSDLEDRANGKRGKIRRVIKDDLDPQNRLGLGGPSGPLSAPSRSLASGGPMSKNGGLAGFWNLQAGTTGSRRGMSDYYTQNAFNDGPSMQAHHVANAAAQGAPAGGSTLVDSFLEKLLARLPAALASAILTES